MNKKTLLNFWLLLLCLIVGGASSAWGDALTTSDFTLPTPQFSENFNSLSATSGTGNTTSATTLTSQTKFGIFDKIYCGKAANTWSIASNATFDSNVLSLSQVDNPFVIASITGKTFGTTGAFSFKVLKTSKCYIGLYGADDNNTTSKSSNAVYLSNDGNGALTFAEYANSKTNWVSIGSYSTDIIEVFVVYNTTNSGTTYGNSITLGSKKAHIFVNGTCVMNAAGTAPQDYTIPVTTLKVFRVCPNASGKTAIIDDVNIYNSLPTAPPTTYTVTYNANGGSGTMTDSSSPYSAGAEVTLLSNTFTAPSGKQWSSWAVTDASSNAVTVTDGKFTMPSSNVTVTAQWEDLPAGDYITVSPTTTNVVADNNIPEFTITTDQTLDDDPTVFYTTSTGDVTTTKPSWITEAAYSDGTLLVSVAGNTGAARTAYFRVEKSGVKSDVITINQAAKTYEIEQYRIPATAHGTITFSPESPIAAGAEVTLTATPADGYSFTADSWVFYKESAGDLVVDESISVTDNQFTMPAYDIYVDGTFTAIAVTGVTLNKSTASIGVGDTETLTATVAPANALDKSVTWTSSNTDVATVDNGVVTAIAAGSATITVTTTDGGCTATCTVTVMNAVTFTAGTDKGTTTSNGSSDEVTKSVITISSTDAAFATDQYRMYSGSKTVISTSTGKITKIEFTGASGNPISNLSTATGTLSTEGNDGTWTGSASSITFTASPQARATIIKVYYATTATPSFSVAEGEYDEAKEVIISCATDGATIYYTIDGTTPTSSSTAYSSAIAVTETTTLKAIAIKSGVESAVASATYTMNRPDAPTFDVATCVFDKAFDLHLSAADGTTIYYTTNGSTPTSSSSIYSTKVAIPAATTTVKAIAVKDGLTSDVASETYTYDSRTTPTFTLSTTSIDLKVNETSSAVTLTTNSDATPSFYCADAHVTLTGTGNSRTISANAEGTYTITVSITGSEDYKDASGTITVNVTKKPTTMFLTSSFSSNDLFVNTTGSLTGEPQYNSVAIDGAEVSYISSDPSVATIAADGTVTFRKAGSTTLTVSYEGNDEYKECEGSYELTLVDTTPQSTEVNITFNNALYGTSYKGTDAAGNGPMEGTVNKVTVTVVQGSGKNLYINDTETRIYGGTTEGTITITAPSGYYITKIDITKGSDWSITASPGSLSGATWTGSASSVVFSASGRSDFKSAVVTLAPIVTLPAAIYATRCYNHALDFSGTGIKAYTVKVNAEKSTARVTEIASGKVPAGEGVILYAEAKGSYAVPVIESAAALDNDLVGVTEDTAVPWNTGDKYNYILQRSGSNYAFNKATGAMLAANRAYLQTTYKPAAAGARLALVFDDDTTTGISDASRVDKEGKGSGFEIYNLKGQRVENPVKGQLYIVNGKKVVMK